MDPAFLSNVIGNLPGVDANDPRLKNLAKEDGKAAKEKKEEPKKK